MEPWQFYFEEFRRRAERIPRHGFGGSELMAEFAHDAYQRTADYLTEQGWDEERALIVTRLFGQTVKEWLAREGATLDTLSAELGRRYGEWSTDKGPG